MEVGAVKQAFNNEVILLKKNLNQAKIQVIHKLTRKAKTLTQKKVPEHLEQKFKRKAASAVNEVLAIKKIKPKDLAKFIVTHTKELKQYLNNPKADQEKACARLLLHKSLQEKYRFLRERFSNVSIEDLLMSRQERRRLKKEAKEKKKKKGKDNKVVNSEGDWDVEDVEIGDDSKHSNVSDVSDDEESEPGYDDEKINNEQIASEGDSNAESEINDNSDSNEKDIRGNVTESESENDIADDNDESIDYSVVKTKPIRYKVVTKDDPKKDLVKLPIKKPEIIIKNKVIKKDKSKDSKKNKNLNEKLMSRKFKKGVEDLQVSETKIIDPFFITSTGENYMSVAEPRQPDEVKEIHKQGNRKLRRAVMFGHVPKIKPRRDHFGPDKNFNRENGFAKGNGFNKMFDRQSDDSNNRNNFKDRKFNNNDKRPNFNDRKPQFNRNQEEKPEKLHPSWEAKKKQSGILPFQGKKIVFDS